MLRNALTGTALAAALLAGGLSAAPADAGQPRPVAAKPAYKPYGKASSTDHVLRRGCKNYKFTYVVKPPNDEWAVEIFVVNPNGRQLLSMALDAASDPKRNTRRWSTEICRRSTVYGVHTIKMKVTWQVGRDVREAYVKPTTFRFTRP